MMMFVIVLKREKEKRERSGFKKRKTRSCQCCCTARISCLVSLWSKFGLFESCWESFLRRGEEKKGKRSVKRKDRTSKRFCCDFQHFGVVLH